MKSKYVICVYDKKNNWWYRDDVEYDLFVQADVSRKTIIAASHIDPYVEGNKIEVWPVRKWEKLPIGFKHPSFVTGWDRERAFVNASPRSENEARRKLSDFNSLGTALGDALRAAGL